MNKTVYVIIPVFNASEFLSKCLDSIFNQTYSNICAICVNDGSTDDSECILRDYAVKYENMIVVNKENGGVSSARNAGIDAIPSCSDSYLTFVDSDDWLGKEYIKVLVETIEDKQTDAVCTGYTVEYRGGDSKLYKNGYSKDCILNGYEATRDVISARLSSSPFAKMYKIKLFENIRYDERLYMAEDVAFTFRTFINADSVAVIDYPEYHFNRFADIKSLSRQKWNNKKCISVFRCDRSRYLYECSAFSEKENQEIMTLLKNDCADNFLGIFPRIDKKNASKIEMEEIKEYVKFINEKKVINKFSPYSKKSALKKNIYLFCPCLYVWIYKIFIKR